MPIEILLFGALIIFVLWMWDVSLYSNVTGWFSDPEDIPYTKSIMYLIDEITDFWRPFINWGNFICRLLIYFVIGLQVAIGVVWLSILRILIIFLTGFNIAIELSCELLSAIFHRR